MAVYTLYVTHRSGNNYKVVRYYPGGFTEFNPVLDPKGHTCNCDSFVNTGKACPHIAMAVSYSQVPSKKGVTQTV